MKTYFCKPRGIVEAKFYGDCLEGIGIPDKGIAIIDTGAKPKVGDIVWCNRMTGAINTYLKQVVEVGDAVIVSTRFKESEKDFQFPAAEFLGVVKTILDRDRNVILEL